MKKDASAPAPAVRGIRRGRQLSVFLDDRPGTLAGVAGQLGERGINIHALTLAEGTGHGYVRMIVEDTDAAAGLLREAGCLFFEKTVLLMELDNRPGRLAEVCRAWADRGINLEYAYCAAAPGTESGLVVVRVDDAEAALAALAPPD
jgi:hypothetical protein